MCVCVCTRWSRFDFTNSYFSSVCVREFLGDLFGVCMCGSVV